MGIKGIKDKDKICYIYVIVTTTEERATNIVHTKKTIEIYLMHKKVTVF
jgi:hypothetical protein